VNTGLCTDLGLFEPGFPFERSWGAGGTPLPMARIRSARRGAPIPAVVAPPWLSSGPAERPFDFCGHMRRLAADVAARCGIFHPIDVSRILIIAIQARNGRGHGLQARVTPLRFADGNLVGKRRGRFYQVQRYFVDGREMLYVMAFCMPRFFDQPFEDKLITLFHEMYHISPHFDGDLRRLDGRYQIHSCSKRGYDEHMARLVRSYLSDGADPALHGFLRLNFAQLQARHAHVEAIVVPRPKLVPVPARKVAQQASRGAARGEKSSKAK
jgi:predicted metallopeptidase